MKPLVVKEGSPVAYGAAVVNVHEAKTHLSRLLEQVAAGGSVVIARAGKPVARLVPFEQVQAGPSPRLGFLGGDVRIPEDFDQLGGEDITSLFEGRP